MGFNKNLRSKLSTKHEHKNKPNIQRATHPRMVRQRIFEGARKWMGPWEGLVFMRLRRNLMYFIFWRTKPPEMAISSHRTTTTFCPFSSSFAMIDAKRPSMWCRASTTTRFAQIPDPDTISVFLSFSVKRPAGEIGCGKWGFETEALGFWGLIYAEGMIGWFWVYVFVWLDET